MRTPKETAKQEDHLDYPEELADRLPWFVERAGIKKAHLRYLLGLTESDDLMAQWQRLAGAENEKAWWLEGVLYDVLGLFNYDPKALKKELAEQPAPAPLPSIKIWWDRATQLANVEPCSLLGFLRLREDVLRS